MNRIVFWVVVLLTAMWANIALAGEADSREGRTPVVSRELVSEALSWVQVKKPELEWSSQLTLASALLREIVLERSGGDKSESVVQKCADYGDAAHRIAFHQQMGQRSEEIRDYVEKVIAMAPGIPWPDFSVVDEMISRSQNDLSIEKTDSGKAEQILFFSAREYERCLLI
ncbi:hypothetical protein R5R73_05815 [Salinicola sp. LHM]|uniref:hypothetical protein n=1 Tax=Salinicola sp. LHM TaxID=3065298 RepID=UPI002ACD418C|nr:hypothetical protein [Salinicola sp. LHM]WQH34203.1 hypothetical protein R5R73_05815 [Salinicola sp. LHM]